MYHYFLSHDFKNFPICDRPGLYPGCFVIFYFHYIASQYYGIFPDIFARPQAPTHILNYYNPISKEKKKKRKNRGKISRLQSFASRGSRHGLLVSVLLLPLLSDLAVVLGAIGIGPLRQKSLLAPG